jgi:predicted NAD-dependent protein-ADP-ribosyltransferase YbiA (DUF1768 family)
MVGDGSESATKDKLRFYSKSADAKPGKGRGEKVADPRKYSELAAIRNWRKILSNFHVCPFVYRGLQYRTIEHAFQAEKIGLVSPLSAFLFAMDSRSDLSRGDGLEARKSRKMVILPPAELRHWDAISQGVMARIAKAKYAQCPEAQRVLLLTGTAELEHIVERRGSVRFTHLERIRNDLARRAT